MTHFIDELHDEIISGNLEWMFTGFYDSTMLHCPGQKLFQSLALDSPRSSFRETGLWGGGSSVLIGPDIKTIAIDGDGAQMVEIRGMNNMQESTSAEPFPQFGLFQVYNNIDQATKERMRDRYANNIF